MVAGEPEMTKIVQLVNSCRECPNRHYFSGGTYECMKVQPSRLNADMSIPDWCPLAEYKTAAQPPGADFMAWLAELVAVVGPALYPAPVDGGPGLRIRATEELMAFYQKSGVPRALTDQTIEQLARLGCGGDDTRWSFSNAGLRRTLEAVLRANRGSNG